MSFMVALALMDEGFSGAVMPDKSQVVLDRRSFASEFVIGDYYWCLEYVLVSKKTNVSSLYHVWEAITNFALLTSGKKTRNAHFYMYMPDRTFIHNSRHF